MKALARIVFSSLTVLGCLSSFEVSVGIAQITSAADGTGTIVTPTGDRFNIEGGTQSGQNLFHSFQDFNLQAGEIATFTTDTHIQNVLGRVIGGDVSVIDGLIRAVGHGSTNLYLLNPVGILFGPNARLDLAGSFTATTASSIGFGNGWFETLGRNDYAALVGEPIAFRFAVNNPGSIVNAGSLAVPAGKSLTLLGGSVVNTGSLTAPGGQIILTAVPGENLVRLNQVNSLLGLEFEPLTNAAKPNSFSPLSLPALLTGGNLGSAMGLEVNADGTIQLISSPEPLLVTPGTAIASGQIEASGVLGGSVAVWGDRVALIQANIAAAGDLNGGTVRIGGDYQGQGTVPLALRTYADSSSVITVDALQTGDGGSAIVWATDLTGFYGQISAQGGSISGNGGLIEISGGQRLIFEGKAAVEAAHGSAGTLLFDPANITIVAGTGVNDAQLAPGVPAGAPAGQILFGEGGSANFQIGTATLESLGGTLLLQATNDITLTPGVSLNFGPGGPISLAAGRNFLMDPAQTITTNGRDLSITAASITAGTLDTSVSGLLTAGNITLSATAGALNTGNLNALATASGNGGQVSLSAITGANTGEINTFAEAAVGNASQAGSITVLVENGDINTGILRSFSNAAPPASGNIGLSDNGGSITLSSSSGNITAGNLFSFTVGRLGNAGSTGGAIQITSGRGNIQVGSLETFAFADLGLPGDGGLINLSAEGNLVLGDINPNLVPANSNVAEVLLTSDRSILAGDIRNAGGQGGDISLRALETISTGLLDTQGLGGPGGNIDITAGLFFSSLSTFTDQNGIAASLSSADTGTGGRITIRHGGGLANVPFIIGDASRNGTAAAITSGASNIVAPIRRFLETYTQGNISLITSGLTPQIEQFDQIVSNEPLAPNFLTEAETAGLVHVLEDTFTRAYEDHFNRQGETQIKTLSQIRQELIQVEALRRIRPALIYAFFLSPDIDLAELRSRINYLKPLLVSNTPDSNPIENELIWRFVSDGEVRDYSNLLEYIASPEDRQRSQLVLLVVSGRHPAVLRATGVSYQAVSHYITSLQNGLMSSASGYWIAPAQALHQALIEPIKADLEGQEIDNLVFIMDTKLRSLPMAAMSTENDNPSKNNDSNNLNIKADIEILLPVIQDSEEKFIIEDYSIGLMPSMSLTDTRYRNINPPRLLAMGVSDFTASSESLDNLPGVRSELDFIDRWLWRGSPVILSEERFTFDTLQKNLSEGNFNILHLATHARFVTGNPEISHIYAGGNERLSLLDLSQLNLAGIDLLTLSACETALGDEQAELGFAGLAYQTGVKTVLASLRQVSDMGTFALMSQFYGYLRQAPIKAEALRAAQLALKNGQVRIHANQLIAPGMEPYPLQPGSGEIFDVDFSHPYYWAWFTMVGSPW